MKGAEKLGAVQMISLLFVCRIFGALTYIPQTEVPTAVESMLAAVAAAVFSTTLCAVLLKLFSVLGVTNIFDLSEKAGGFIGKISLFIIGVAFIAVAVSTVVNFQHFISVVVYPQMGNAVFVISLILAAAYGAYAGIEALSRFAVVVAIVVVLSFAAVAAALFGDIELVFLQMPDIADMKPLLNVFYEGIISNTELLVFLVLVKSCPKDKRIFPKAMFMWTICFVMLTFFSSVTLGEYAATQNFPIYSMMASASFSILQRLDFLHIVAWVFISFLKTALYIFCAVRCLTNLSPTSRRDKTLLGVSLLVGGSALLILSRLSYINIMRKAFSSGIIFWLCIVTVPIICLAKASIKRKRDVKV